MTETLNSFRDYLVEQQGVSSNTLESYMRDIVKFSDYVDTRGVAAGDVTSPFICEYTDSLKENGKSAATITRTIASIRSFYRFLIQYGFASHNPTKGVKLEKTEKKPPEILDDAEIRTLLSMPSVDDNKGIRDKAMLELLYATGIRASELINLNVGDVNCLDKNTRGSIVCAGAKEPRTIPIHASACEILRHYIEEIRPKLLMGHDSGEQALFINLNGQRLTRQGFWKIVKVYAENAGINKDIKPHTLRHSFAMHLYRNGASLQDLQKMLGHADISSTQVYANIVKQTSFDVYDRCHPFAHRV
ncbi:MAG: tyrosine recombinase [Oscillospiraceae bacterium]|jgi:integrase/recombinase XerD|nr:tyrosine recombinase [Oscillospiraceae bacterium]